MHSVSRQLDHLSQILMETHPKRLPERPDGACLAGFFQATAADCIRIGRCDWRGHTVSALLWHLPNLRPDGRSALTRFVLDRWEQQVPPDATAAPSALPPDKAVVPETASSLSGTDDPVKSSHPVSKKTTSGGQQLWTTFPKPHRDWFDRFTDWVVAVLSLFQQ